VDKALETATTPKANESTVRDTLDEMLATNHSSVDLPDEVVVTPGCITEGNPPTVITERPRQIREA